MNPHRGDQSGIVSGLTTDLMGDDNPFSCCVDIVGVREHTKKLLYSGKPVGGKVWRVTKTVDLAGASSNYPCFEQTLFGDAEPDPSANQELYCI